MRQPSKVASLPIRIRGTGEYVPALCMSSEALDARWQRPAGWTRKHSGIACRHYAAPKETSSMMAAEAARRALAAAGLEAHELDCVVSACSVMEQAIPCSAALVQRRLGLEDSGIPAFDVNATCLSFLAALDLLGAAIAVGRYERALIVSSEIASAGLPPDDDAIAMLFGDGAAAVVIERCRDGSAELLGAHFETFSAGAELCQVRAGGTRLRPREDPAAFLAGAHFEMDGRATYRMAARRLPDFIVRLLHRAGTGLDAIRRIVPHQASAKALRHLERLLQLAPDRLVRVLETRGNQMAASIPVALHHAVAQGRIVRGDTIALVGSGAGLSFGGAVLRY